MQNNQSKQLPSIEVDYYKLFSPSFVSVSEERAYDKLLAAIHKTFSPREFWEFSEVVEIAINFIELQRIRHAKVSLITNPAALVELLSLSLGGNIQRARQIATEYYGASPAKSREALNELDRLGFSEEQIDGHAIFSQTVALQNLDRLEQTRLDANRRLVKSISRRKEKRLLENGEEKNSLSDVREGGQIPRKKLSLLKG